MSARRILTIAILGGTALSLAAQEAATVHLIDAGSVAEAFAAGRPLLEVDAYKVHASRRTAPGEAEVHHVDTDIIYVLQGEATFVTGGTVVDGRSTGPDEVRGQGIRRGTTHRLVKGAFIVVPHGTPHWFRAVEGTFLYYVVKVPDGRRSR